MSSFVTGLKILLQFFFQAALIAFSFGANKAFHELADRSFREH